MAAVKIRKPRFISHYLVLRDILRGKDVRRYSSEIEYLTSRIENIKLWLSKQGLVFEEDARAMGRYSFYKPYRLVLSIENFSRAYALLEKLESDKIKAFLEERGHGVQERSY